MTCEIANNLGGFFLVRKSLEDVVTGYVDSDLLVENNFTHETDRVLGWG
jgi:hypothetical protein